MNTNDKTVGYPWRFIARIVLEADTPLAVGNGEKDIMTDALVAKDMNGLPYIPGTSIAGVIRHSLDDDTDNEDSIFGFHKGKKLAGSKIIFSDAVMIGKDGKALDGIQSVDFSDDFYNHFANLPIRQHVCINEFGTAKGSGKFDGQVVYKGTRFVFEIELVSKVDDGDLFNKIIDQLNYPTFRLGGGTHNGLGKIKVISVQQSSYHLKVKEQLDSYLSKSSCLRDEWKIDKVETKSLDREGWIKYEMVLKPVDFFLFGSGMGDEDADDTQVVESIITWEKDKSDHEIEKPIFKDKCILVPGSSVKGALAHRTAYYWNKEQERFADDDFSKIKNIPNEAVNAIFGCGEDGNGNMLSGNFLIDDMLGEPAPSKIFNHVKIDRFAGGALAGALFTEKVTDARNLQFSLTILVKAEEKYRKAFELALNDLKNGLLPLGGSTNRGMGMFNEVKV